MPIQSKEDDLEQQINYFAMQELDGFGKAIAGHISSVDALQDIAQRKINPEYADNNYHQQAGFSNEIKHVARHNAEVHISKSGSLIATTGAVGANNDPTADIVEVKKSGNIKTDNCGSVSGGQMKLHKDIASYDKLTNENFEKYKSVDLIVPADHFDVVKSNWEQQCSSLEKQISRAKAAGNDSLARHLSTKKKNIEDSLSRLKPSKVTSSDAMEARKSPLISTSKDVAQLALRGGLESAKNAAAYSAAISGANNILSVIQGDKSVEDAAGDTLRTTSKAAGVALVSGAATATIAGAMQAATNQTIKSLGNSATPALIVQSGSIIAKGVIRLVKGEISSEEFSASITKEGATLATSMTGSNLGAVLGTCIAPGVGTVIGGMLGGMAASLLSSSAYAALQNSIQSLQLSEIQLRRTEEICERIISSNRIYRANLTRTFDGFFSTKSHEIQTGFDLIFEAMMKGESADFGLRSLAKAFGTKLTFDSDTEFDANLKSGATLNF